jgi:hypothetical protein
MANWEGQQPIRSHQQGKRLENITVTLQKTRISQGFSDTRADGWMDGVDEWIGLNGALSLVPRIWRHQTPDFQRKVRFRSDGSSNHWGRDRCGD